MNRQLRSKSSFILSTLYFKDRTHFKLHFLLFWRFDRKGNSQVELTGIPWLVAMNDRELLYWTGSIARASVPAHLNRMVYFLNMHKFLLVLLFWFDGNRIDPFHFFDFGTTTGKDLRFIYRPPRLSTMNLLLLSTLLISLFFRLNRSPGSKAKSSLLLRLEMIHCNPSLQTDLYFKLASKIITTFNRILVYFKDLQFQPYMF